MAGKIGEGHLAAMARLGLKELRNLANPSRESVADTEIGLYGTRTQGEIADARGGPGQGPEQESPGPEQESPGGTMNLDELRANAKELAQSEGQGKEQGKEQGQGKEQVQERDRSGPEL